MSAGYDHSHPPASYNAASATGIGLNIAFVVIEAFYGWKVDSLALLADAGHNLSDSIRLPVGRDQPLRARDATRSLLSRALRWRHPQTISNRSRRPTATIFLGI